MKREGWVVLSEAIDHLFGESSQLLLSNDVKEILDQILYTNY